MTTYVLKWVPFDRSQSQQEISRMTSRQDPGGETLKQMADELNADRETKDGQYIVVERR